LWGAFYGGKYGYLLPDWSALAIFAGLAAGPCVRWRFGLRTLLVATTIAAVVLGLVVYVARK
jgi:hypothetical protein